MSSVMRLGPGVERFIAWRIRYRFRVVSLCGFWFCVLGGRHRDSPVEGSSTF